MGLIPLLLKPWWIGPYAATATDGSTVYPTWIMDAANQRYAKSSSPTGSVSQVPFAILLDNFTRASTATYFDASGTLRTSAINEPRFTYDPATLQPLGLLVEEARTNLLLNSGTPATQTVSLATGTYTLWIVGSGSCTPAAGTAIGTGFASATAGTPNTFTITTAGTVNFTVSGGLTRFQCENGSTATSYIPTTGSTVTRAQDEAFTNDLNWMDADQGTYIVKYRTGTGFIIGWDFNGVTDRGFISDNAVLNEHGTFRLTSAGVTTTQSGVSGVIGTRHAIGMPYITTSAASPGTAYQAFVKDGSVLVTSTTFNNVVTKPNRFSVGRRYHNSVSTGYFNSTIEFISYYPKRLTDAEIQRLTTL